MRRHLNLIAIGVLFLLGMAGGVRAAQIAVPEDVEAQGEEAVDAWIEQEFAGDRAEKIEAGRRRHERRMRTRREAGAQFKATAERRAREIETYRKAALKHEETARTRRRYWGLAICLVALVGGTGLVVYHRRVAAQGPRGDASIGV